MGLRVKKSPGRSMKMLRGMKRSKERSSAEPSEKKMCLNPGKQFVDALRGSSPMDALKSWLYLVSNMKERMQMDKETTGLDKEHVSEKPTEPVEDGTLVDSDEMRKDFLEDNSTNSDEEQESNEEECCYEHIDNFLHAGGSPADFIAILPPAHDATYANSRHIFKALSKVLLRIAAAHQERIPKTVKSCQELLNSYTRVIKEMLEYSKSFAHRRLVLELFTAMVVLDTSLGKEILSSPFLSGDSVQNFSSSAVPMDVRIAYLNFLIALLMEHDDSFINTVINKPWLLTTVMDDLQYDVSQTLVLFLTTLQKSIVKNPRVTKSSKLAVFDYNSILCLFRLYTWKGPQNRPKAPSQWAVKKVQRQKQQPLAEVNGEEADLVVNAVHELLLVLLTDHRFGIIFRDPNIGFKGDRLNSLVLKVLQKIGQFWEHPKTADLISKVLAACPDALSSTMASMEPIIVPRPSAKWFKCVDFLKKVIESQRPCDVLERQASKLSSKKFSQAAIEMCAPPHVVKAICSGDVAALWGPNAEVAKLILEVLTCTLRKISTFIEEVKQWPKKGIPIKFVAVLHLVRECMPQHYPSLSSVEKAWRHWIGQLDCCGEEEMKGDEKSLSALSVLSSLLEFLDSFRSVSPLSLEAFFSAQSSLKLSMTNSVLSLNHSEEAALLRNRFYRLLLTAHDHSFTMENEAISAPLQHLFRDVLSPSGHVQNFAHSTLQMLIERSRSLEGSYGEAFIWLSAYEETFCDREELASEFAEVIVGSMMRATSQYSKYLDMIADCDEQSQFVLDASQSVFKKILSSMSNFSVEVPSDGGCSNHAQPNTMTPVNISSVSPWLPAFLEVLAEKIDVNKKRKRRHRQAHEKFLTLLIVRLLFRFLNPLPPLHLILRNASALLPMGLTEYLQSWLPGSEPKPLSPEVLDNDSLEVKLSLFLYSNDNVNFDEVDLLKCVSETSKSECLEFSPKTKMNLIQLVHFSVFHLTQWTQLGVLSKKRARKGQELLTCALKVAARFECSCKSEAKGLTKECVKVVFSHPLFLQLFSPLTKNNTPSTQLLTSLLVSLGSFAKHDASEHVVMGPYKSKVLCAIALASKKKIIFNENPVPMLAAFPPTFSESSELLDLVLNLPLSLLIEECKRHLEVSHWYSLAVYLLTYVVDLRSQEFCDHKNLWVLSPSAVSQIASWLIEMLKDPDLDSSALQQAFLKYIESCPQHTSYVPKQLLTSLLNASTLKSAGQSLAGCISRRLNSRDVIDLLKANCRPGRSILERPAVLLPVLGAVLKSEEAVQVVSSNWFKAVYDHLQSKIEKSVCSVADHPEWLEANIEVIVILMKFCMSPEAYENISESLKTDLPVLSVGQVYQLQLIVAVLKKRPCQLLQLLLKYLAESLKLHESNGNQGPLIQNICQEIIQNFSKNVKTNLVAVRESKEWQESIKFALKLSLRVSDHIPAEENDLIVGQTSSANENDVSSLLLKVLSLLFSILYTSEGHEHISMVYKLCTLHSEFVNTMIDIAPPKFELVNFLLTLVTLQPSIVDSTHVPVILAAYGATLSRVDCALLQLLQVYEQSGLSLSQYRPYLWGLEAANQYSVWSDSPGENQQTLWQQPRPNQVLGLLNRDLIKSTIAKFPIHRHLNIGEGRFNPEDNVYDPSFFLPLFSHLLAPESPVMTPRFVRTGALAVTFSCLASYDIAVRAAAYTTLARFLANLHMSSGSNKQVLLHLMSSVQKGVQSFGERNPQLPSVSSVFLAEAALELANPLSNLYQSLMNFLLTKPVMKLNTIPEFWTFLHSENVNHIAHRCWILKVMCSGLRTRIDFELCLKVVAFKLLPSFYSCCLSDKESKILILRCIQSAVQDQYGACCLVRDYALSSWIHQVILGFSSEDKHLISEMICILEALWKSLCLPVCPTIPQVAQPGNKIMPLVFALLPKLSAQLGATTLTHFIHTLCSIIKSVKSEVQKYSHCGTEVSILIDLCTPFILNPRELYEISRLGCDFVEADFGSDFLYESQYIVEKNEHYFKQKLQGCLKQLIMLFMRHGRQEIKSEVTDPLNL